LDVRFAAASSFGALSEAERAPYLAAFATLLGDNSWAVRRAAASSFGKLSEAERAPHLAAFATLLGDKDQYVRRAAASSFETLSEAERALVLVTTLASLQAGAPEAAAGTLAQLDHKVLNPAICIFHGAPLDTIDGWMLAAQAIVALLVPSQRDPVAKKAVLRLVGNCHGMPQEQRQQWFTTIKSAAREMLAAMAGPLHQYAVEHRLARELCLPSTALEISSQADEVPYLRPGFVCKFLSTVPGITIADRIRLYAVAMMLQAQYVHTKLENEHGASVFGKFGDYTVPSIKDLARMLVKVFGDYAGKPSPVACLMDAVRRSVVTAGLEEQEGLLQRLAHRGIRVTRQKSTMPTAGCSVKQTIVNLLVEFDAGRRDQSHGTSSKFTFADMLRDSVGWDAAKRACLAANDLDMFEVGAAEEIFEDPSVKEQSIGMIVELQLYIDHFLEERKLAHGLYKIDRAENADELLDDTAKHATVSVVKPVALKYDGDITKAVIAVGRIHADTDRYRRWARAHRRGRNVNPFDENTERWRLVERATVSARLHTPPLAAQLVPTFDVDPLHPLHCTACGAFLHGSQH